MFTYMHTCDSYSIHMYMHIYMYDTCIHTDIFRFMHIYQPTCIHTNVHTYIFMHVCIIKMLPLVTCTIKT